MRGLGGLATISLPPCLNPPRFNTPSFLYIVPHVSTHVAVTEELPLMFFYRGALIGAYAESAGDWKCIQLKLILVGFPGPQAPRQPPAPPAPIREQPSDSDSDGDATVAGEPGPPCGNFDITFDCSAVLSSIFYQVFFGLVEPGTQRSISW